MKLQTITSVSLSGKYYLPGETFDCDDQPTIDHLIKAGAVAQITSPSEDEEVTDVTDLDPEDVTDLDTEDVTEPEEVVDEITEPIDDDVSALDGMNENILAILSGAGIDTTDKLKEFTLDNYLELGIAKKTAKKIIRNFE